MQVTCLRPSRLPPARWMDSSWCCAGVRMGEPPSTTVRSSMLPPASGVSLRRCGNRHAARPPAVRCRNGRQAACGRCRAWRPCSRARKWHIPVRWRGIFTLQHQGSKAGGIGLKRQIHRSYMQRMFLGILVEASRLGPWYRSPAAARPYCWYVPRCSARMDSDIPPPCPDARGGVGLEAAARSSNRSRMLASRWSARTCSTPLPA